MGYVRASAENAIKMCVLTSKSSKDLFLDLKTFYYIYFMGAARGQLWGTDLVFSFPLVGPQELTQVRFDGKLPELPLRMLLFYYFFFNFLLLCILCEGTYLLGSEDNFLELDLSFYLPGIKLRLSGLWGKGFLPTESFH